MSLFAHFSMQYEVADR